MAKFDKEYFTRDRLKLGTKGDFKPENVTDKFLKTFADCGFNWVVLTGDNSYGDIRDKILDFCDENGIEVYLHDRKCIEDESVTEPYRHHPSYTGTYVRDEPGSDDMPTIAPIYNAYLKNTGRIPFVNLLPMYANAAQLRYGAAAANIEYYDADPNLYYKHCKTWMELSDSNFVSVDIYPLYITGTYSGYIESLNLFARAAREFGKDFNLYIQCYGWRRKMRHVSLADVRWQVYNAISFGAKGIMYWAYNSEFSYVDYAIAHFDGEPTPNYFAVKSSIAEMKRLNDVYCKYKNLGAFNFNCTDQTPYLRMTNPLDFPTITKIESDDPLLVGCFEEKAGNGKAFTMVNMNELLTYKKATAKFSVDGYTKVTAWYNGYSTELIAENGMYNINLDSGEGVFVTLE